MIARRFSAPVSRFTNRPNCIRLVASSCIETSTRSSGPRASSHTWTELSHCTNLPSAARRGRRLRCFARLRLRFHTPAAASHPRTVSALTRTPRRRRACSASNVGPKPACNGSAARASTRSRTSGASARFDLRPRSRWTAAPSPSALNRRIRRRKWRRVTPNRAAPVAAANIPLSTCLNTAMRSRSLTLNSIRSSPGSRSASD